MHHLGTLTLVSSLLAPVLSAQATFTLQTRGAYGVVAEDQAHEVVDGLADATVITATTSLEARIDGARARTTIRPVTGRHGRGVVVEENGCVFNSGLGTRLAGTLDEEGKGPQHVEPHTLSLIVTNSSATAGIVTITWSARADEHEDHADATCAVDLDDDQVADFTGASNERPVVREFVVRQVGQRFVIHLTTEAESEIVDAGSASYSARLGIYFREGASCAATPYGDECGGRLRGAIEERQATLSLSGAAANSFGALLIGHSAASIGIGDCRLLTLPLALLPFRTDGQGAATHQLRLPPGAIDLRVQDVILRRGLATSNGLRLECR